MSFITGSTDLNMILKPFLGIILLGYGYDNGTGEDRFRYEVNTFGPTIRFGFNL